jgi:hypothetical protein
VRTLPARDSLGWLRHVDFFPSNTIIRTDWVVRVEQWSSGSGAVAVESNKPPNLFHWNHHIVLIQGRFITVQRINGYFTSLRVDRKIITRRISSLYKSLPFPSLQEDYYHPLLPPNIYFCSVQPNCQWKNCRNGETIFWSHIVYLRHINHEDLNIVGSKLVVWCWYF